MYKFLFHLITDPLPLPFAPFFEYLILLLICVIAYITGWAVSPGGKWGRFIHWVVRAVVFVSLWAVIYFGTIAYRWLKVNWVTVSYTCACILFIGTTAHIVITNIKRLIAEEKEETPNERNER